MRKPDSVNIENIREQIPEIGKAHMEVTDADGEFNHNMVSIVDKDARRVLGVFDQGYKLVRHGQVLDRFHKVIGQDNFLGGYYCTGKKMHVYYYPDDWKQRVEVGHDMRDKDKGDEDTVLLGMRVTNSVDGSNALKASIIGFRQVCSNGMWGEELVDREYQRHTANLSLDDFERELDKLLNIELEGITAKLERASEVQAETEEVLKLVKMPQALKDRIQSRCEDVESLWEIYNQATRLITHGYREEKGETLTAGDYSEEYLERIHRNASKVLTIPDRDTVSMQEVSA